MIATAEPGEVALRLLAVLILAGACGGCSGMKYAMDEYSGVRVDEVAMPDDTYRVFDKPNVGKMMVTPSLGAAMGQGFGSGLLLGSVDNTPPKPMFDAAALAYLRQTGRDGCRVVESYLIVKPQFEVKYDCTPPAPAMAAVPTPRRQR